MDALTFDAQLDGGLGDDTITGGKGDDLLLGSDGSDSLYGAAGRDLLIAGLGADYLQGGELNKGTDSDLLIAGTTTLNDTALQQVLGEWVSSRTYADRVQRLRTGASGLPKLDVTTVADDSDADTLRGALGNDWFFADLTRDTTDKTASELLW